MGLIIWAGVIPTCLVAAWLIFRRPLRNFAEEIHVDHARDLFRQQREWLEAALPGGAGQGRSDRGGPLGGGPLARRGPLGQRPPDPAAARPDLCPFRCRILSMIRPTQPRHATALFEFRKGRWHAEGKRLDEVRPDEAVRRNQRFEPVVAHPRRVP